jgi:hypothetical protein
MTVGATTRRTSSCLGTSVNASLVSTGTMAVEPTTMPLAAVAPLLTGSASRAWRSAPARSEHQVAIVALHDLLDISGMPVAADDDEDLARLEMHLRQLFALVEGAIRRVLPDVAAEHGSSQGAPRPQSEDAPQADDPARYEDDGGDRHAGEETDGTSGGGAHPGVVEDLGLGVTLEDPRGALAHRHAHPVGPEALLSQLVHRACAASRVPKTAAT